MALAHLDGVGLEVLLAHAGRDGPLDGHDHDRPLLQELLLRLLNHDGVGVAHHGNQHVEEQDWDEDLENDKDQLCHGLVWTVPKFFILKEK